MARRAGYLALALAAASLLAAAGLRRVGSGPTVEGVPVAAIARGFLLAAAVLLGLYGGYRLLSAALVARAESKRDAHTVRNVLRLGFAVVAAAGVLGVLTDQWVGLLFSLGILGVAVTFALQQPILSFLAWIYIMIKRPYGVGDRVRIGDARGDVTDVDFLVTTLWEIDGDLVTSNQPSGRLVTVPNSVVLSESVYNYSWEAFPFVWNELPVQVAYETDLAFAREAMAEAADDYLGDEMEARVERYRRVLDESPVELEVGARPTVNVRQEESWVELRLRYLVHPRRGTQVRNDLYERILERFNEAPERVKFPVSRNR